MIEPAGQFCNLALERPAPLGVVDDEIDVGHRRRTPRNTIKTHLRGAYRKIGAKGRVQALAWWYTHREAAAELERHRALGATPTSAALAPPTAVGWGTQGDASCGSHEVVTI